MKKSNNFVSFSAFASPSISVEEYDFICSGSYSSDMSLPSGTPLPLERIGYIRTGKGRVFLVCPGCGRRYLLKEENITTPIFDMSCSCGTTLEIEEEK